MDMPVMQDRPKTGMISSGLSDTEKNLRYF